MLLKGNTHGPASRKLPLKIVFQFWGEQGQRNTATVMNHVPLLQVVVKGMFLLLLFYIIEVDDFKENALADSDI